MYIKKKKKSVPTFKSFPEGDFIIFQWGTHEANRHMVMIKINKLIKNTLKIIMRIARLAGRSEKSRDFVRASACNDLLLFLFSYPKVN